MVLYMMFEFILFVSWTSRTIQKNSEAANEEP